MKNKLFNIPLTSSFVDVVAKKYLEEFQDNKLALAEVLFLVPSKRACSNLKEAFVRQKGMEPLLLPKIKSIGDVDEDELFLTGYDAKLFDAVSPAVSKTERQLIFTKLIMARPADFGVANISAAQACFLASSLASLIDTAINENVSFDKLNNLVPTEYASHWQETLKFLEIITKFWPEILKERGNLSDPSFRYNQLLRLQASIWQKTPPENRVVLAGITATYPAMKELIKTALSFDDVEIILSGLDKELEDEAWQQVEETHPQFELKELLEFLEVGREEVADYFGVTQEKKDRFLSEVMRPAVTTEKWREIKDKNFAGVTHNIQFIDCQDIREEALSIALIMRANLEVPEKTTALVTYDRNLARRVVCELERWNIKIDDSAGKPLSLTPVGQFLRLIMKVIEDDFSPVSLLSLLKHPYMLCGYDYADFRMRVREYEKVVLRSKNELVESEVFINDIKGRFKELLELCESTEVDIKALLTAHIKLAEDLAKTPQKSGEKILWKGEDGDACAKFIADLYENADVLGNIKFADYIDIFEAMMVSIMVRARYGTHPRLKILGPIESRLVSFDSVIIGEVNEGIWPKLASADPWMSRPMKKDFGVTLPEKAIGITAHDFCSLLAADEVYITRANRVQGTPMVKSRWWLRMETVLSALGVKTGDMEDVAYRAWARFLDRVEVFKKILPPEPKPPVSARPRKLSVSAIENLMRDPYMIFARFILKLKPLDELEQDLTVADYGNIIHGILEKFNNKYTASFPKNAKEELLKLGQEYFLENKVACETRAFWWPSFEKTVDWLVEKETSYRADVLKVNSEVQGSYSFEAPAGKFEITAKADRVDVLKNGKINIIDYKTGQAKSKKEIKTGYAPQLPLEALIAVNGGFDKIVKSEVEKLLYWRLAKEEIVLDEDIGDIISLNEENVKELVSIFDFETTGYLSRPNPLNAPKYSDYDHLARVKEWSVVEDGADD